MKAGDSAKLLALDLHDWFKVEHEGHYLVTLKVDPKALGLHDEVYCDITCTRRFTIGREPKLPTIAEFNNSIPVLGGKANEERLKSVIHETIVPKQSAKKPLPPDLAGLLAWSRPVNGLAARVEDVSESWGGGITVLVRIKKCLARPDRDSNGKSAQRAVAAAVRNRRATRRRAMAAGQTGLGPLLRAGSGQRVRVHFRTGSGT